MTEILASPDELTLPRVRPLRALKLTTLLLAVTFLALAALWLAWNRRTIRQIESRVAQYRQRNEPTRLSEILRPTPLPDDRDALYHLRRAATALPHPMPSDFLNWELNASLTIDAPMERRGRAFAAATAAARALLPPALACTDANWRSPAQEGDARPSDAPDDAEEFDRWIRPLITASTVAHLDHDDDAAIAHAQGALTLTRIFATTPSWRAQAWRLQRDANNWAHLEALLTDRDFRIQGDDVRTSSRFPPRDPLFAPATRARMNQLLSALLDEAPTADANRRALLAARCDLLENPTAVRRPLRYVNDQPRQPPWWTPFHSLAAPYVRRVTADELDDLTALIRASEQPNYAVALRYFPRPRGAAPRTAGVYPADILERDLDTYPIVALLNSEFRTLRDRRRVAILLASRLSAIDQPYRVLTTIQELVPDYLPRVPIDPLTGARSWTVPTPPRRKPAPSTPTPNQ